MILQHNMAAMNAQRFLGINNGQNAKNLEKLSSGFRVNRGADDAAGLAISEKMRGQIRGLAMASQNCENGVSLIQTAEGGLNETHAILHRMRELAVQSSNGTYQDDDRVQIAKEVEALKGEIDRIANSTHFNGIKLLDGSLGGSKGYAVEGTQNVYDSAIWDPDKDALAGTEGAVALKLMDMGFPMAIGTSHINDQGIYGSVSLWSHYSGFDNETVSLMVTSNTVTGEPNGRISLLAGDKTYIGKFTNGDSTISYTTLDGGTFTLANSDKSRILFFDEEGNLAASMEIVGGTAAGTGTKGENIKSGISGVLANIAIGNAGVQTTLIQDGSNNQTIIPMQPNHPLYNAMLSTDSSQLIFQIGANGSADQTVGLHVDNMSCANLGPRKATGTNPTGTLTNLDVSTVTGANDALLVIDAAVSQVSANRSQLGALQNRMEHTLNNLGVTRENLQSAESVIRDTDMAKEMMEFTKNNILTQASQAMLAQANTLPQGVLSLFK